MKLCAIPANGGMIGYAPCDQEWGHDGDLHSNEGDGYYSRHTDDEHHQRQKERMKIKNTITNTSADHPLIKLVTSFEGGIEASEARGQQQLVNSDVLPVDASVHRKRATLEAWGVKFGDRVEGDELFVHVELPKGWKKARTDHSMWSNLLDDKDRVRAAIFYKAAHYDRKASINLCTLYRVEVAFAERPDERRQGIVKDAKNNVLFTTDWVERDEDYLKDSARDPATVWLNENKPGWEDPTKYWDET